MFFCHYKQCDGGASGLVDRVFAVFAGGQELDSHRRHMSERFFSDPIDQNIRTQYALSWKIVVSEWRSVIALSLNVGGGVRLIDPAILYMCMQKHYRHNENGHTAPGVRGNGSVPLSHSGNVVTRIRLQQKQLQVMAMPISFGSCHFYNNKHSAC